MTSNTNDKNNNNLPPQQQQQTSTFQLPEAVEKSMDSFLAKVERHEFTAQEGVSAQLQCALEAIDLYQDAFNKLNDDPEEYWAMLVAINSRLQSAPALRILFSNLGKRVAKHLVEGIRSCETQLVHVGSGQQQASHGFGANNANHNASASNLDLLRPFVARANTTTFNTSVSMLQMDEYYQDFVGEEDLSNNGGNVAASGVFGNPMMSPATYAGGGGGGQFPNMTRVPTTAILDDHGCLDDLDGQNGTGSNNNSVGRNNAGGNNNNGSGNGGGNFSYQHASAPGAYGLENLALMTPAAVGTTVARPHRSHQHVNSGGKNNTANPSAFKKFGGDQQQQNNNNNNNNKPSLSNNGSMTNQPSMNTSNENNGINQPGAGRIKRRRFISVNGARQAVEDALMDLRADIESTTDRMSKEANHHIQHGESVLAFGCTNTLTSFFRGAASQNVRFKVYLIDTANGNGGGSSLEGENNMTVERIPMSSCYAIMSRVSKVFLSTEAVFANGGLVAFAGTHAVCLAAKVCNVPVIVVVASLKFSESFPSDSAGTTLIKVDQSRSVEWRDFLPPADILPAEFGSSADAFDCLYDTDSSDEESDISTSSDDDTDSSDDSSSGDEDGHQEHEIQNHQQHSDAHNLSDTMISASHGTINGGSKSSISAQNKNHHHNNIISNSILSPRSMRQVRKSTYKKHRPPVQVWNPLNEYVPPECISIFVTELHEITPALVQVFVEGLNEPKLD